MPARSSPAPPGSSARTSREYLLDRGFSVVGMDNLHHRRRRQHRAPDRPRLRVRQARRHELHQPRRAARLHLPLREPGLAHRLPARAHPDPQGRQPRHAQRARPGQGQERALPARLHLRGLRRPARAPAARGLLGQRQPGRAARRVRRGQALLRGHDHGLPPRATACRRASSASSTPTARACASRTAARSPPS